VTFGMILVLASALPMLRVIQRYFLPLLKSGEEVLAKQLTPP